QPSVVGEAFGSNRPVLRACFRQLYIVAAEIPSSPARSLTVRLYGASSLAKMASRRSGEYFMGTFSLPQVGDSNSNICRGSNYSDSGGHPPLARRNRRPPPTLAFRAKKIPTDKGWDLVTWWSRGELNPRFSQYSCGFEGQC